MARILLIDDDQPLREVVAQWLESLGHQVSQAQDALTGIQHARSYPVDLIITDVQMPAGGAPILLQGLKDDKELATVPVIICSGLPEAKLKQWFPDTPKRRIHPKPVNWILLDHQLSQLLGLSTHKPAEAEGSGLTPLFSSQETEQPKDKKAGA